MSSRSDHVAAARAQRQLPRPTPDAPPDFRAWIRAGALAASSHNTQPWRVRIDPEIPAILIQPDDDRRCPRVDPNDAHLFKSLGCMAENIRIAAGVNGFDCEIDVCGDTPDIRLTFHRREGPGELERYRAIAVRQCTRSAYDASPLSSAEREALSAAGRGQGVRTLVLEGAESIESVVRFVERGNVTQLDDAGFRRELTRWIRFNPESALEHADGLSAVVMGQPSLPQWLGRAISGLVLKAGPQNRRDAEHIRSSSALAVLVAERDEVPSWVETGRVVQRLTLTATALDLKHAYINQPIEVPELRAEFARWLGRGAEHPLLMLRIGRAAAAPYSLRRPLEAYLAVPAEG
ncbi:hypothetical protein HFP89_09355 [Wenzhouxiangella sp. XN79A]|uniref:Acg family FMN-binding oxidoreductase n=1 Tax=Wenzhouxiangella sp. XN79A TaxID=2724193 RepID=UPI00144A6114|nr:hypothetical protein [Wenzhouxiangella sp. XN79A]NKI35373.1 hypothetical protein [Wenzhouxiangella sp. XN79A]